MTSLRLATACALAVLSAAAAACSDAGTTDATVLPDAADDSGFEDTSDDASS